jgi:hypothetical protein
VYFLVITKDEHLLLNKFLEELGGLIQVKNKVVNEYRAVKGTSLRRPILAICSIDLTDENFSTIELMYFPNDWKWGEPSELMRGRIFLQKLLLRNPLPSVTKPPFFGGMGVLIFQGNVETGAPAGFMKSNVASYRFKALGGNKDNKLIESRINSDFALLDSLNKEFRTGKGRPLPDVKINGTIIPFGGFDIFDIDGQKEKVADNDFWKIDDPDTPRKTVRRLDALRKLAVYLQKTEYMPPPPPPPPPPPTF